MGVLEVLIQEKESLSSMIMLLRNSLESAPAGNLRISHCGQSVQYYYRPYRSKRKESKQKEAIQKESKQKELKQMLQSQNVSETEAIYLKHAIEDKKSERGVYIKKRDEKLVHDLAQRDYDETLLKALEKRLGYVDKLIDLYEKQEAEHLYEMLNPYRKKIVHQRILTDREYAEQWNSVAYEGKLFAEGTAVIYTNRGERVRSKSEKIIADTLIQKAISYRYEAPVTLRGLGTVYPDFTILNVRKRKEIFWEHLGMMDQKDYCERALRKIEMYQRNGIILGKNLIITYETSQHPLETQMIERNIEEYCMA
ncbi:MAG: hypothetical protein LUD14_08015 [Clostridiales bacterium]|nr:hypothetical protein [Clostridiales bacterium]